MLITNCQHCNPWPNNQYSHDILPRIRADHLVLSVTHEWERLTNMLIDASEELDRRLLRWSMLTCELRN